MNEMINRVENANEIINRAFNLLRGAYDKRVSAQEELKQKSKKSVIGLAVAGYFVVNGLMALCGGGEMTAIGIVILLISGAALYYLYKRNKQLKDNCNALIEEAKRDEATGNKILSDNAEALAIIPEEHRFPEATAFLCRVLNNGQAKDYKEALNLCDAQVHSWKMASMRNEVNRNEHIIADNLRAIEKSKQSIRESREISEKMKTDAAWRNVSQNFLRG